MLSTEAKWHNERAMALKERFDAVIRRVDDVRFTGDDRDLYEIAEELRSMAIEIEYVCRM